MSPFAKFNPDHLYLQLVQKVAGMLQWRSKKVSYHPVVIKSDKVFLLMFLHSYNTSLNSLLFLLALTFPLFLFFFFPGKEKKGINKHKVLGETSEELFLKCIFLVLQIPFLPSVLHIYHNTFELGLFH